MPLSGARGLAGGSCTSAARAKGLWHNWSVRFLRMKPGHGEVLIAEGDVELPDEEIRLIEEFRRQLDAGLWAAVPVAEDGGHTARR